MGRVIRAGRSTGGSGLASFLVLVGCLVVLGGTFLLGVAAGRRWPGSPVPGRSTEQAATETPSRRADRREHAGEPGPTLTFYRELTAPLTSPPPPPRAPKPTPRAEKVPKSGERAASTAPAVAEQTRYTIQMGAYRTRAQADALLQRLAAAGHAAYVVDGEGPGGVRYRVRVGTFATREAAQEAAARVAREQSLTAFVTAR